MSKLFTPFARAMRRGIARKPSARKADLSFELVPHDQTQVRSCTCARGAMVDGLLPELVDAVVSERMAQITAFLEHAHTWGEIDGDYDLIALAADSDPECPGYDAVTSLAAAADEVLRPLATYRISHPDPDPWMGERPECLRPETTFSVLEVIVSLHDGRFWPRERTAAWLESLDGPEDGLVQ